MKLEELKYLENLAFQFPTIAKASTEIINLSSILNLPKGTEHFISDLHGEAEQFVHILKNGSGSVKGKVEEEFGNTLSRKAKKDLTTLIYYPEERLAIAAREEEELEDWYQIILYQLIRMSRRVSLKYTRSKVRKAIPPDFAYVIDELMHEREEMVDKEEYYKEILATIIKTGRAKDCIIAFCNMIQRLVVDHLHIVGDIYDRGPGPHIILDRLMQHHSVDIQWGNHDAVWIGAASGSMVCIATAIRLTVRYGLMDLIEDGYGINMIPLVKYALDTYGDDPCECFGIKYNPDEYNLQDLDIDKKMHKAISVLQFKLEGQVIARNPDFHMEDRRLLDKINYETGTISIYGKEYPMRDMHFPTVDPKNPYALTPAEEALMERLQASFMNSDKLQRHVRFLLSKGSLYLVHNSNLLYHGSIPLNEDGSFREIKLGRKTYNGKAWFDALDSFVRKAYYLQDGREREFCRDMVWYTWTHRDSPLFGKEKMTTFERYFIKDKEAHVEEKTPYYRLYEDETVVERIMAEFGLDPQESHIINGHVPIKRGKGESPIKCGGKLLIIDGGFSKAYQPTTGIAGYTLVFNSYGLLLVSHMPFTSTEDAIQTGNDIHSETMVVETVTKRQRVADTDTGKLLQETIDDLHKLLRAYQEGLIRERE